MSLMFPIGERPRVEPPALTAHAHAWWRPEQVATYLQLPLSTIWRKIRAGEIRATNYGTSRRPTYRISAAELRRIETATQ